MNPQIAVIHDFAGVTEMQDMKDLARGKLKSTPLYEGNTLKAFTRQRTSKVMYMNELLVPKVSKLSRNIELATGFKLKHERFASENFQVMNYGIGGKICGHLDSSGIPFIEDHASGKSKFRFVIASCLLSKSLHLSLLALSGALGKLRAYFRYLLF